MNTWVYIGIIVAVAFASSVITYLLTRLRVEKASTERVRALAEAVAALENERAKFEQAARGIEESAKRKALDEFLADLHVEERRYVRQHRVLFAHRKSLVLQERIFFRNIPISNWVEHEVAVEEGADLDGIAKTLSVFNALEGETSASRNGRRLMFRAG
jgi:outer membrane murein-binding lipoprotein Lpp